MARFFSFLTFLLFVIGSMAFLARKGIKANPPNILVIIADDWSPHAGAYGDKVVLTPAIDKLAQEGVLFEKAFVTAPSCTPSRASILTGRYPHQLQEGANLWGTLPVSYLNYTQLLAQQGYNIGLTGKGWGPGNFKVGGYTYNPAGPAFKSFNQFIDTLPAGKPFCFWLGSADPHRPYSPDLKKTISLDTEQLKVPAWLPNNQQVRADLLDYYAEVGRFDQTVGQAVKVLEQKGLLENTLIIVTSDNGMPFPRAKANVYDAGTKVPLIMRWGDKFKQGTRYPELVSLIDLAPTILRAAGVAIPQQMTGKSLLSLLQKEQSNKRFKQVYLERERHANVRENNVGYSMRAIRTSQYLYIFNLQPQRWPAGDPEQIAGLLSPYGDIDGGPAKQYLVDNKTATTLRQLITWNLEKRPAEELYDLIKDPDQLHNVAAHPAYAKAKEQLRENLNHWRQQTQDPYLENKGFLFDDYPYYGGGARK